MVLQSGSSKSRPLVCSRAEAGRCCCPLITRDLMQTPSCAEEWFSLRLCTFILWLALKRFLVYPPSDDFHSRPCDELICILEKGTARPPPPSCFAPSWKNTSDLACGFPCISNLFYFYDYILLRKSVFLASDVFLSDCCVPGRQPVFCTSWSGQLRALCAERKPLKLPLQTVWLHLCDTQEEQT